METYDHRGLSIAYDVSGQGEPMVLLHNGGMSRTIWRDVAPILAQRNRVYALDLLGFGDSARPGTGCLLEHHIEIVDGFIRALGLGPAALVGNCMGAAIALSVAARRPETAYALVLMNPLTEATFRAGGLGTLLGLRRALPTFSMPVVGSIRRIDPPRMLHRRIIRMQLGAIGRKAGLDRDPDLCACYAGQNQSRALVEIFDDLGSYGAAVDRFTPPLNFPPITSVWGLDNKMLSADAGRELNKTLRPVTEEWLAGCGHLPMVEQPERVAAIIQTAVEAPRRAFAARSVP
jgi:pimeloyl-ACP methyl ester carboxylesterase